MSRRLRSHTRGALALALLAATSSGCRTAYDFTPVSAAQVRVAMGEISAPQWSGTLRDDRGGVHKIDGATPMRVHDSGDAFPDEIGVVSVDANTKELDISHLTGSARPINRARSRTLL